MQGVQIHAVLKQLPMAMIDNIKQAQLSCRRETARCFVSLSITLSHSRSFEMTPLSMPCVGSY